MQRITDGFRLGGRYVMVERIASGGMADVWRAEDEVLRREVAVKVMRADAGQRGDLRRALPRRGPALGLADARQHHDGLRLRRGRPPHLPRHGARPGPAAVRGIREAGPIDPVLVRSIVGQAALALGVAHEARVVHRDVKPANILVRPDGVVKLTDFGIARALDASGHTRVGEMLGTPNYISPEQAKGEQATGASDLYALGVVAHEMLTGVRPFDRGTPIATAMSHVNEPPPPLADDVPQDLRAVIGLAAGEGFRTTGPPTRGSWPAPRHRAGRAGRPGRGAGDLGGRRLHRPRHPDLVARPVDAGGLARRAARRRPSHGARAGRLSPPSGRCGAPS